MTTSVEDVHDAACLELSKDEMEMGHCPRGAMCDCYWCPRCHAPEDGR